MIVCALAVAACLVRSVVNECGKPAIQPDTGSVRFPKLLWKGKEAKPHSWPWQVQLLYKDYPEIDSWGGVCGGTIVTPYHILTTADCLEWSKDAKKWKILIGAHNDSLFATDHALASVAKFNTHESYIYSPGKSRLHNNIAIVTVANPIEFGDKALDICLTSTSFNSGTRCFITGWGETGFNTDIGKPISTDLLMQTDVFLFPFAMCKVFELQGLDETMICAFNKQMDRGDCGGGDRGGPLVCQNDKSVWYLQGIITLFGVCGSLPSVYTRVPHFYKWIEGNIRMSK